MTSSSFVDCWTGKSAGFVSDGIIAGREHDGHGRSHTLVHASKERALQALLIDPVVNSASAAVKLLDELWDVNRPYILPCV
jgi:hypothetical protein